MMETFLVLGLCFILYEALDFFQGCIHSATPSASDQIDAYRRQLHEQRQKHQEEQFLANLTPLLSAQLAAAGFTLSTSTTPTASTASVISDLKVHVHKGSEQSSTSIPDLSSSSTQSLKPSHYTIYDSALLQGTSSLPRDYYYLQQQQLKNKNSSRPLLSKFASTTDNRIHPEYQKVLGLPAGVVISQPKSQQYNSSTASSQNETTTPIFQNYTPVNNQVVVTDLKRAVLSNNHSCNCNLLQTRNEMKCLSQTDSAASFNSQESIQSDTEPPNSSSLLTDSPTSSTSAVGSVSYISQTQSADNDIATERTFTLGGSCSSSHQDFREIECERLRRQCVSIKRIYSISEKF